MSVYQEVDPDGFESEITPLECCQSGCTACVLDCSPLDEAPSRASTVSSLHSESEMLEAIRLACAFVEDLEPGIHQD